MQLAVGAFIENFSNLEWFSHDFLISFSTDKLLGRKAARQEFGRRVETLIELSRERVDAKLLRGWLDIWKRALVLADHRNAIAHNPPVAFIFADTSTGEPALAKYALHLFRRNGSPSGRRA